MQIGIDYTSAVRQRAGIGRYTRELVRALLALDSPHDYTIFAATGGLPDDRWPTEIERLNATHSRQLATCALPISDDWLARLWHRLRLPIPVEVVTGRLDVFYSPDFTLPPTLRGTRALLTVHDLSFVHHPDAFVPSLRRYLERAVPRSIDRADIVLADSTHTRSDLIGLFGVPPDDVQVVNPGVSPRFQLGDQRIPSLTNGACNPLNERLRQRYSIGDNPYILGVGTLQPRKNYVRLIQAFARMGKHQKSNVQLCIVGGRGWLYEDILAEADRHEDVHILGFVDDEDLPALYREAALFVFPSLYEGFGLPVLEAMASGTPVVCSDTSSLPEVVGDAALLVDPLDIEAWSVAMKRALEDEELREDMIERGLSQAARCTWQQSAEQLLKIITSLEEK